MIAGAGIGGHAIQVNKLASSAQHGFSLGAQASAGTSQLLLRNGAGRGQPEDRHRRCRQRHRDRHRDRDQRERQGPRLRRGGEGGHGRAPGVLLPQDRRELQLHRRHLRARRTRARCPSWRTSSARARCSTPRSSSTVDAHARDERARGRDPGCPRDAQGHHDEPRVGQHHAARGRLRRDRQEDQGARRRLQRGRHRHALRADREARPDRQHDERPAEGPAVRRLGHDVDAQLAQEHDDQDPVGPRSHEPEGPRHRRAQGRLATRPTPARASSRSTPTS